ncbi:Pro-Pol polyprotein [Araneus ventricosus]|uniref:Pro-Pol polyprotein n=1 Tax=Araneus ventricosus TaxID=182803 RepID=A0A4Y2DB27_ARAVE|nr:Pro-Pol polyprotein [Araneus ventricosus]
MPFDGDSHQSIKKWIELFEDVVNTLNLSDFHKLVFGKRSLKGEAKLYIQSETGVNSWEKLKDLLLSELVYSCNSAELHEMLSKRKLKDDGALEVYLLKMKQLCNRCNAEGAALMQYVINGIPDSVIRKTSKKQGEQEGELPLDTYHVDHLGTLESTNKNYKHILCVIDSFTKFVWLYPTKSTSSHEVISKLELQKSVFGNPRRIISDKGRAFNFKEFGDYCSSESIQHLSVTTGLPRANGQVERLNSTIIAVISKLSKDEPTKWFKFVP